MFNLERKLISFSLFKKTDPPQELLFLQRDALQKPSTQNPSARATDATTDQVSDATLALLKEVNVDDLYISSNTPNDNALRIALNLPPGPHSDGVYGILDVKTPDLAQSFKQEGPYLSFLLQGNGEPLYGATLEQIDANRKDLEALWRVFSRSSENEATVEFTTAKRELSLASFVRVGVGGLSVISLVPKAAALEAIQDLIRKTILFFFAVVFTTLILSVLTSKSLTSALNKLLEGTQRVAAGDFNVDVDIQTEDEVGALSKSFNLMTKKVAQLMIETVLRARMESELETAKAVQGTLFPPGHAVMSNVEIAGYYQPATECGGDWWFYSEDAERVYIWVGDATGHGAPAALLTSAARAAVSIIQYESKNATSAHILKLLNRAIFETSKGKMMMTFFLGVIDKKSGLMTYCNASHEPPMLLHPTQTEVTRDSFIYLSEVNNPRLGQDLDYEFKETSVQLQAGDQIVFYTDGVYDIANPEHKKYGERKFIKALTQTLVSSHDLQGKVSSLVQELEAYRKGTELDDDVTLVLCTYKKPV